MSTTSYNINAVLSLWRSPIDVIANAEAASLQHRQPQCTIVYDEDFTQITMFNYAFYIAEELGNYDSALDAMFTAMSASHSYYGNVGGLAYIPQLQAYVNAYDPASQVHQIPDQINMIGSGTGGDNTGATAFYHFAITPKATPPDYSRFLTDTLPHTSGGKFFRSISFQWAQEGAQSGDVCIYATGWNTRAVNCTFQDCPTAFYAMGEGCGLEQCTIQYTAGTPNDAVAVYLAAPEVLAIGPGVYQQISVPDGGPTGCTAIALGGASGNVCEHAIVADLQLLNWAYAINYGINNGTNYSHITNMEAQSFITCVQMQPPSTGSSNQVTGDKYTACTFMKSSDSADSSPIVFIDTNGQTVNAISDIEFLNCTVISTATGPPLSSLFCYQITSGSNIRIIGGTASNAGPGVSSAGIAITPTTVAGGPTGPGRVTILGVDLSPTYPQAGGGGAQTYALYISADLQDVVTVDNCRMYGYGSSGPILVTGTVTNYLFIRNCQGYNDQSTPIASGVGIGDYPTSTTGNTAATAGALSGGVNYYGASLAIFTVGASSLSVYINGVTSTYPANSVGTVFLNSPYDEFYFAAAPLHFHWIGK